MNIVYAEEFIKQLHRLPPPVQRFYRQQESRFRQNWRDPRLHTKRLTNHPLPFSFRITRSYRVIFILVDAETALFATIGHRKDVYRR